VGIRSGNREEYDYVRENNIRVFSAEDVISNGIKRVIEDIQKDIRGPIYLSVDMDAIDPAFAPALGRLNPME